MTTTTTHWSAQLRRLRACPEAVEWAATKPSLAVAWQECERSDWMLWLLATLEIRPSNEMLTDITTYGLERAKRALLCVANSMVDGVRVNGEHLILTPEKLKAAMVLALHALGAHEAAGEREARIEAWRRNAMGAGGRWPGTFTVDLGDIDEALALMREGTAASGTEGLRELIEAAEECLDQLRDLSSGGEHLSCVHRLRAALSQPNKEA